MLCCYASASASVLELRCSLKFRTDCVSAHWNCQLLASLQWLSQVHLLHHTVLVSFFSGDYFLILVYNYWNFENWFQNYNIILCLCCPLLTSCKLVSWIVSAKQRTSYVHLFSHNKCSCWLLFHVFKAVIIDFKRLYVF